MFIYLDISEYNIRDAYAHANVPQCQYMYATYAGS